MGVQRDCKTKNELCGIKFVVPFGDFNIVSIVLIHLTLIISNTDNSSSCLIQTKKNPTILFYYIILFYISTPFTKKDGPLESEVTKVEYIKFPSYSFFPY